MGSVKKALKKSLNFTKNAYTGGFVKDIFGGGGDPGKAQAAEVRSLYGQAEAKQAQLFGQQTAAAQKAANIIPKAYGAARKNVQVGKSSALTRASDAGQAMQAQAQQSLAARGLYNSTVMDNARMGISSQTTRDLADIDASYAQLMAELDIGEGQAMSQAQQFLSGTYGSQSAGYTNLKANQAGQLAQIQYEDPDAWLNSLLGIGGNIAGIAIGNSLGSMGGGSSGAVLKGSGGVAPGTGPLLDWEG